MKLRAFSTAILTGMLISAASAANACSVVPGYEVPTNLELAANSDVILIGEVAGQRNGAEQWDNVVLVKPITLLKGASLPALVEMRSASLEATGFRATKSDPNELRKPNPDALAGACVRYVFAKGRKLLLFLKTDEDGKLVLYRSPFSRDAEDVVDEQGLWVKAVKEYAVIGAFPKDEWKTRLKARIEELQAKPNDPDAIAIARDMEVELSGSRLPDHD